MRSFRIIAAALALAGSAALLGYIQAGDYYYPAIENDFIRSIKDKITAYNRHLPEERVYLHFDRPFYSPGETLWFSAYVRDGRTLRSSAQSDILHVELVGPKGNVEGRLRLIARNGRGKGDFTLNDAAPGGIYKVKAYTNWQKNEPDSAVIFEKEIKVQSVVLPSLKMKLDFERKAYGPGDEVVANVTFQTNENRPLGNHPVRCLVQADGRQILEKETRTDESGKAVLRFRLPAVIREPDAVLNVMTRYGDQNESVSRSVPIVLNRVSISFFPEGGDLVAGLESRVAFRAVNEYGKPADVEGIVMNEHGSEVARFNSHHQGMGLFTFRPGRGGRYHARITRPEGISDTFFLPEPLPAGYVLQADPGRKDAVFTIQSTQAGDLSVVMQMRGKVLYATSFRAMNGYNRLAVPVSSFPPGVAQVTLFDVDGVARAERLIFLNRHKKLNVSIAADKEKYLPREKVRMTVTALDDKGIPVPTTLSLSVANDQLLAFADDRSGNIMSCMLLEHDLRERIEEPAFYFDENEPGSEPALDHLLMTSGWRRFTWKKLLEDELPGIRFPAERAIVAGTVADYYTRKPVPDVTLKVSYDGSLLKVDENGLFASSGIDLSRPTVLTVTAPGYHRLELPVREYGNNLTIRLHPENYGYRGWDAEGDFPAVKRANMVPAQAGLRMQAEDMQMVRDAEKEEAAGEAEAVRDLKADEKDVRVLPAAGDSVRVADERMLKMAVPGLKVAAGSNGALYYRGREFSAPVYKAGELPELRTDFRSTVFWKGDVETDRTGRAVVEFYLSDDITSFRAVAEGMSGSLPGRVETVFYTQIPVSLSAKVPVEMATGDMVSIPLTIRNNMQVTVTGVLTVLYPQGLKPVSSLPASCSIPAGQSKTVYLDYRVQDIPCAGELRMTFSGKGFRDAFVRTIRVVPRGFPVTASFSGSGMEAVYEINIANAVGGSISGALIAYPSVVSDLMQGVEAILREPSGCFEQTSMSSYPNAMVMDYLKSSGSKDDAAMQRAKDLLDKGYKRLTSFETREKGYEWFGAAPAHEALTAYGLMQFNDMKAVYAGVDQGMIDRTAEWLMSRRDGKGGFLRNGRALDQFGGASDEITNAYIVYALAEAGYHNIARELELSCGAALASGDAYQLALAGAALYKAGDRARGDKVLEKLYRMQSGDGSWTGLAHSVTRSTGKSLIIETTSLAVLAILYSGKPDIGALQKAVDYIVKSRSGYGAFGSTQGTILALKALTAYAKFSKRTAEGGTLELYVDGKKVAEKRFAAGEKEAIMIDSLGRYLEPGRHHVKVRFAGMKEALPHSLAVNWSTSLPASSPECRVSLSVRLASHAVPAGETVRLAAVLKNTTGEGLPSTMAIIGIPAGLSVQPWQLKELQDKKVFDYYEVIGSNVVAYYRQMAPSEAREINLDLKADVPGEYFAPASSAYLYYTNEHKVWAGTDKVTVSKM